MANSKKTIYISGMHCRSCEILLEEKLGLVNDVKKVTVSHRLGTAEIEYENNLNLEHVQRSIIKAGYSLGKEEKTYLSHNPRDWQDLAISGSILVILFFAVGSLGLFNIDFVNSRNYNSLLAVLLIGLTAGISTCMALVGGLVLGASARFAEKHPTATPLQKFKPHLFFNLGRIVSYTILGGVIGFAGSFFQLSNSFLGLLTMAVGVVMLLLGAQLVEIFPFLKGITFTLPKEISRFLGVKNQSEKEYSHVNSALMGAGTFFLPCGFTQAMQLFAISSGNPVTGALTMGTFALGTAPGLLGIGGLTSVIRGTAARIFFKAAGIVVIVLAIFNISNGYNLTGFNPEEILSIVFVVNNTPKSNVVVENGVQIVRMTQDGSGYHPNSFTIRKGIPVRWIINSTSAYSCASSIIVQKYKIRRSLNVGENIIEFTPTDTGKIPFSCSMGMYRGVFNVN